MKFIHIPLLSLAASGAAFADSEDFRLDAYAHLTATLGQTSGEEGDNARHGHDPNDAFTLQGLEFNLSPQYGEHLGASFTYNSFLDTDHKIDGEWEEAYLKLIDLPGGFNIRAGRLLNNVSTQNDLHLHSWDFVDANLITTRFLGEEGLLTNGVEVAWQMPTEQTNTLIFGFGDAVAHEHEEGHMHGPSEVAGEESAYTDNIFTFRYEGEHFVTDFQQFRYGATFITGDTGFGKSAQTYGVDFQYQWRENGIEAGGKYVKFDAEAIYRRLNYSSEDGSVTGNASEWGIYTAVGYGFAENWELGARYGYTEGVDIMEETPEQHRYSLALTRQLPFTDHLDGAVRLQYNFDQRSDQDDESSLWLQFSFRFGN